MVARRLCAACLVLAAAVLIATADDNAHRLAITHADASRSPVRLVCPKNSNCALAVDALVAGDAVVVDAETADATSELLTSIGACQPGADVTVRLWGRGTHRVKVPDPQSARCSVALVVEPGAAPQTLVVETTDGTTTTTTTTVDSYSRTLTPSSGAVPINISQAWGGLASLAIKGNAQHVVIKGAPPAPTTVTAAVKEEVYWDLKRVQSGVSIAERCAALDASPEHTLCLSTTTTTLRVALADNAGTAFEAVRAAMPVVLESGGGNNTISWRDSADVAFHAVLGSGADTVVLSETGPVTVDMTAPRTQGKEVRFEPQHTQPSVHGSVLAPSGVYADSRVVLVGKSALDSVAVGRRPATTRGTRSTSSSNTIKQARDVQNVVVVRADTPGQTVYYTMENDTAYLIEQCEAQAHISFDAGSSDPAHEYAHNAWVLVSVPDVSVACSVFVNSYKGLENVAGLRLPANSTVLPKQVLVRQTDSPVESGFIEAGKVDLRVVGVDHVELTIAGASSGTSSGTITLENTPSTADLFVSVPSSRWSIDVAKQRTALVVLDGNTTISANALSAQFAFIAAGAAHQSTVNLDTPGIALVRVVAGCVLLDDRADSYELTPWMLERAREHGVVLDAASRCRAELFNASLLRVASPETVELGALYPQYVAKVELAADEVLALTLDPALRRTDKVDRYTTWQNLSFTDEALAATLSDGTAVSVVYHSARNRSVAFGAPLLTSTARVEFDIARAKVPLDIDLAGDARPDVRLLGRVELGTADARAVVSNYATTDGMVMPVVRVAPGVGTCTVLARFADGANTTISRSIRFGYEGGNYTAADPTTATSSSSSSSFSVDMVRLYIEEEELNETEAQTLGGDDKELWAVDDDYWPGEQPQGFRKTSQYRVDVAWPFEATKSMLVVLEDSSLNAVTVEPAVLEDFVLELSVGNTSALSFNDGLNSTLLFTNTSAADFDAENQTITLSSSDDAKDSFCFDPCADCTRLSWQKLTFAGGSHCRPRLDESECRAAARIHIAHAADAPHSVLACGAAPWDARHADTAGRTPNASSTNCTFAVNSAGTQLRLDALPRWASTAALAVAACALGLTALGTTAQVGAVVWCRRRHSGLGRWWAAAVYRDVLADQYSWAAVAATAALAELHDLDCTRWGSPVAAILLELKHFVLDAFRPCTAGEPTWFAIPVYVFWAVAGAALVLRVVVALMRRGKTPELLVHPIAALHSWATAAGVVLLPLVGYTLAYQHERTFAGYGAMAAAIALLLCQPLGPDGPAVLLGVLATVAAILVPMALCVLAGVRGRFVVAFAGGLEVAVVVPIVSLVTLWHSHFRRAALRGVAWKLSLAFTVLLRVAAMGCGVAFYVLIFLWHEPDRTRALVLAALWFAWVGLPWLCLVPLTASLGSVLTGMRKAAAQVTRRSMYEPIFGDDDSDTEGQQQAAEAARRALLADKAQLVEEDEEAEHHHKEQQKEVVAAEHTHPAERMAAQEQQEVEEARDVVFEDTAPQESRRKKSTKRKKSRLPASERKHKAAKEDVADPLLGASGDAKL